MHRVQIDIDLVFLFAYSFYPVLWWSPHCYDVKIFYLWWTWACCKSRLAWYLTSICHYYLWWTTSQQQFLKMDAIWFPKMAPFEEKQLSQQFNSNMTLEAHHTFILTSAQWQKRTSKPSSQVCTVSSWRSLEHHWSIYCRNPTQLEQSTAPLVPEVVDIALEFFLKELEVPEEDVESSETSVNKKNKKNIAYAFFHGL